MDCLHLELSNQTIDIDLKHDTVRCKKRNLLLIEGGRGTKAIKAAPPVISELVRRINEARKDKTIDCRDLHGGIV